LPSQPVGTVHNSVEVDASSPDPDLSNNDAEADTVVRQPGGELSFTGSQIASIIVIAVVLLGGGWVLVVLARRRRSHLT
jgi:hypothetical protein